MKSVSRALTIARKTFLCWLLIAPAALLNGIFREAIVLPLFGPAAAPPMSGILLALLTLALTWFFIPYFGTLAARHYCHIGTGWLALTVLFEFGFGRFAAGKTWSELLHAYDMRSGNLWPVVLGVVAAAPLDSGQGSRKNIRLDPSLGHQGTCQLTS